MSDNPNDPNFDPISKIAESVPDVLQVNKEMLTALKLELKQEMLEEFKNDKDKQAALKDQQRRDQAKEYQDFVIKMKQSPEPWVDVQGWVETDQGVEMKLDWNSAFVTYLREEGMTGSDDDEVVQKYVTLLLRDMSDRIEQRFEKDKDSSSEFE